MDDAAFPDAAARIAALDWAQIAVRLDASGCAVIPALLDPATCTALARGYGDEAQFRSRVIMQRHGYGRGEYRYFRYPLPPVVAQPVAVPAVVPMPVPVQPAQPPPLLQARSIATPNPPATGAPARSARASVRASSWSKPRRFTHPLSGSVSTAVATCVRMRS